MSFEVTNVDPPNYSRNVSLDVDIFFKIYGMSESDLSDLSIVTSSDVVFRNLEFQKDYKNSYFNVLQDGIAFNIVKNSNYLKGEHILLKVFKPSSLNYIYSIKTLSGAPYLYYSNVSEDDLIKEPKKIRLEFGDHFEQLDQGSLDIKINGFYVVKLGSVAEDFSGNVTISNSEFLGVTIDHPEHFKNGNYKLEYSISNVSGSNFFGKINFNVQLTRAVLPAIFPQATFEGFNLGLDTAKGVGDGKTANIKWHKFLSRFSKSEVFSLIYINQDRLSLFETDPAYIVPPGITEVSIDTFYPGKATAIAVRGMEAYKGVFDLSGMITKNEAFSFPEEIFSSEIFLDSSSEIFVSSTIGYPSKGLLIIDGSEVIKYKSKTPTSFVLSESGRGLNNTRVSTHPSGVIVKIFYMCQDKNTNIGVFTAQHTMGSDFDRNSNLVGTAVGDFTPDDKRFFQGFDYCGYHQALPDKILKGIDECGSYLGGEFNGQRGFNIFDRVESRNEVLLEQVGEPVILLKRKWQGQNCDCIELRRQHPRDKTCGKCFGTGFLGGFDQFENMRRFDRRVLVRFRETKHDLNLSPNKHLNVVMEPQCWTLPIPSIIDRDVIVRFGFDGSVEYMYEVLDVTKERFVYQHYGRQNLSLKRLDKTDLMYTFKYME